MDKPVREQLIDPICGMHMDPETAPAMATYDGRTFYFCSDTHKQEFERDPDTFAKLGESEETGQ